MAVIKKYNESANPDGKGDQIQQSLSVSGLAVSDVLILPTLGKNTFTFRTTGSGVLQFTCSSRADVEAGTATWFDNDIVGGPTLTGDKVGNFGGVSAIRINNLSGTSDINVITKEG